MFSAEDYIEMRRNAHRGKWLTYSIFMALMTVGSIFLLVGSIAEDEGVVGALLILLLVGSLTISGMVKAYRKVPFELGNGHDGSSGFGGDCGGD